jgi:hypothetical protein
VRIQKKKKNEIKNKQEGNGWMTQVYRSQKKLLEVNRLSCFEKDEKDEKHHHQKPVK